MRITIIVIGVIVLSVAQKPFWVVLVWVFFGSLIGHWIELSMKERT